MSTPPEFRIPDEGTIIGGLCALNCEIFNYDDVQNFLVTNALSKKVSDRFITWLIALRIIPLRKSRWGEDLCAMCDNYYSMCKTYFKKNPTDPLATISMRVEEVIRPDIDSMGGWMTEMLTDVGLTRTEAKNFPFRVSRMFAMLACEVSDFSYSKGLIRIGAVAISMTTGFTKHAQLPFDFAEAVAFYITRSVISVIPVLRNMEKQDKLVSHFDYIDEMILGAVPKVSDKMKKAGVSSLMFGLNYELFWYAEHHSVIGVMNIWDQILGRLGEVSEFLQCLTVCHIKQIEIPDNCMDVTAAIRDNRKWDLLLLLDDARIMLSHQRSCGQAFCQYFCPCLKKYHGYQPRFEYDSQ